MVNAYKYGKQTKVNIISLPYVQISTKGERAIFILPLKRQKTIIANGGIKDNGS